MYKFVKARMVLGLLASCVFAMSVAATPAHAGTAIFADHVGPIYSGNSFTNWWLWSAYNVHLDGHSSGTAYTGVWYVNSNGARASDAKYCASPGCYAGGTWNAVTGYPNGYPTVHNHGNASPSYFYGINDWL